jgi:hypothetical protein
MRTRKVCGVCFGDAERDAMRNPHHVDDDSSRDHIARPIELPVCDARGCECLADVRSGRVALCSSHAWRLTTDDPLYRVLA